MVTAPGSTRRMFARPAVWAGVSVLVAAVVVQVTRTGVDILALLMGGFVLLLIERTLGDWVADRLGPVPTVVIFIAVACLGVAYATAEGGRARLRRVFAAADAQGYHTVYFSLDDETDTGTAGALRVPLSGSVPAPPGAAGSLPAAESRPASHPPTALTPAPTPTSPASSVPPASASGASGTSSPAPVAPSSSDNAPAARQAGNVHIARLTVLPALGVVGETVVFHADLSSDGTGALPSVEFSVDGHPVAVVTPDAHGVASARWNTRVPGQYVIRAGLSGALVGAQRASAVLSILPGKVQSPRGSVRQGSQP